MRYLSGLLVAVVVSLSATAVAAAQTPSPTATQTSVPTPTVLASATPTPSPPPFNGAVPLIVELNGVANLDPGLPPLGVRQRVSWKGVGDASVNYELDRSTTDSAATRDFQRLATIPGSAPVANGLFSYTDPDLSRAVETCYRVRAVSGNLASAYSPERCLTQQFPTGGVAVTGRAPSAPGSGSGVAPETATTAPPLVAGVVLLSIAVALGAAAKFGHRQR